MSVLTIICTVLLFLVGCASHEQISSDVSQKGTLGASDLYSIGVTEAGLPCHGVEELRPCDVCDAEGRLRVKRQDGACADVDCTSLNHYSLIEEGDESVCVNMRYGVALSACAPTGDCADSPDFDVCEVESSRDILRAVGPCSEIVQCHDRGPPVIEYAPNGTLCEGGTCISGQCVIPAIPSPFMGTAPTPRCEMFPSNPFCREGTEAGVSFCEFRVETPGFRNCEDVCEDAGTWCLGAWDDYRDSCSHQERQDCSSRELDQICRCAMP